MIPVVWRILIFGDFRRNSFNASPVAPNPRAMSEQVLLRADAAAVVCSWVHVTLTNEMRHPLENDRSSNFTLVSATALPVFRDTAVHTLPEAHGTETSASCHSKHNQRNVKADSGFACCRSAYNGARKGHILKIVLFFHSTKPRR